VAGTNEVFSATVATYGPSNNEGYVFHLQVPDLGTNSVRFLGNAGDAKSGATNITCTENLAGHSVDCTRPALGFAGSETISIQLAIDPSYSNTTNPRSLAFTAAAENTPTSSPVEGEGANTHLNSSASSVNVARVADVGVQVTSEQVSPTAATSSYDAVSGTKR